MVEQFLREIAVLLQPDVGEPVITDVGRMQNVEGLQQEIRARFAATVFCEGGLRPTEPVAQFTDSAVVFQFQDSRAVAINGREVLRTAYCIRIRIGST